MAGATLFLVRMFDAESRKGYDNGTYYFVVSDKDKFMQFDKAAKAASYAPPRAGELTRSVLNSDRARKELGWKPSFTLAKGIQETYNYFLQQKRPISSKNK